MTKRVRTGVGRAGGPGRLLRRASLVLGLALLVTACGLVPGQRGSAWGNANAERDTRVALEVDNNNFLDARIYVRWNGDRRRIGVVSGNSKETFRFPWRAAALRIEVDFIAGGGFLTDHVSVDQGGNLYFRIPAHP